MLKKLLPYSILIAVILINFAFGFPRLSKFSGVDEPYWTYRRVPNFWKAVSEGKWKNTKINDKPGITVALVSGPGLFNTTPKPLKELRQKEKTPEQLAQIQNMNFSLRLPLYIFTLLMLVVYFSLLRKLFNDQIANIAIIFIGLSPLLLGISIIINPDSLLWIFLPLTMLSYLVFQKEQKRSYLYLSGIFLGLSLLTKYVANILYVYLFMLLFLDYIFFYSRENNLSRYLKKAFLNYLILIFFSALTFFILFPATWVKPELLLKGTFLSRAFESAWPIFAVFIIAVVADMILLKNRILGKILSFLSQHKLILLKSMGIITILIVAFVLLNTYLGMKWYDFESIQASPKASKNATFSLNVFAGNVFADFYALIFGLTPFVFIFFISALVKSTRASEKNIRYHATIFYFSLFILLYYFASTANHVGATVRYQIALYPLASIIAAIGCYQLISSSRLQQWLPRLSVYGILIAISVLSLYLVKPFYFTYSSALLPSRYVVNLKDMGDGSFEAAEYLNNLPNAGKMTIWSDKGAVCESFVGKCVTGFNNKKWKSNTFDYMVASSGRKSRSLKFSQYVKKIADIEKLYTGDEHEYKVLLDGREGNFVKVVRGGEIYKK